MEFLVHDLVNPLNPEISQRLLQQLEGSRLIVGLQHDLEIAKPHDVVDNGLDREAALVGTLSPGQCGQILPCSCCLSRQAL